MLSPSILFSAAAIFLTGCAVEATNGQVRRPASDCPMNFKPYCEVSGHRAEPVRERCRCIRHSDMTGRLHGEY